MTIFQHSYFEYDDNRYMNKYDEYCHSLEQDKRDQERDVLATSSAVNAFTEFKHDKIYPDGYNNPRYWLLLIATIGLTLNEMCEFGYYKND